VETATWPAIPASQRDESGSERQHIKPRKGATCEEDH
jgi:hypothetical protein